jgi:predicted CopG family antitoxin
MQKKLTITVNERVYRGLHRVVGRRNISKFIEKLVRPHVVGTDLDAAYGRMAADEAREAGALQWCEGICGDIADEAR